MIPGVVGHLRRRLAHGWIQGKIPHPGKVKRIAGEARVEQGFSHGGEGRRVEEGFCPRFLSDEIVGWRR
jgi:hypothetical protein